MYIDDSWGVCKRAPYQRVNKTISVNYLICESQLATQKFNNMTSVTDISNTFTYLLIRQSGIPESKCFECVYEREANPALGAPDIGTVTIEIN